MNRREHSHRIACTMQVTSLETCPPKSRSNQTPPKGRRLSRTLPPTFLFLLYSVVKDPTPQTQCRGPVAFGSGPAECRSRGSLGFHKGELSGRQRRAALVVGRI